MSDEASTQETGANGKPRHYTPNVQLAAFGRLTRDPEAKTSVRGHPYTRARIACNVTPPKHDGDQQTWYFDVTAFRNQAVALAKCKKGDGVHVMGTLNMEQRNSDGREYQNFSLTADAVMAAAATRRTE